MLQTLSIVSSLALPNRLRIGRGDSLPLFDVLLEEALQFVFDDDEPNLCGKVFDFSQGRCFTSGSASGYNSAMEMYKCILDNNYR